MAEKETNEKAKDEKVTKKSTKKEVEVKKEVKEKTNTKKEPIKEEIKEETVKEESSKEEQRKEETTKTITGLDEKVELILVYLISLLGFIFALMKDKKVSKNQRFNYNQAATLWIVNMICNILSNIGGSVMEPVRWVCSAISLILLIFTIIALVKAYGGERYEIPLIADLSKSIWGKEEE